MKDIGGGGEGRVGKRKWKRWRRRLKAGEKWNETYRDKRENWGNRRGAMQLDRVGPREKREARLRMIQGAYTE